MQDSSENIRPDRSMTIMGLDACKGAWVVVRDDFANSLSPKRSFEVVSSLEDLSIDEETLYFIGIDIPIGLLSIAEKGGRACEREARRILPHPRSTSVFSAPTRATLESESYEEALRINRAGSQEGIGISIQAYNIIPRIKDADLFAQKYTNSKRVHIYEVHPELSFFEMAGKKLESKHSVGGRRERQDLLVKRGFRKDKFQSFLNDNSMPKEDDLLDAAAVAWSTRRIAEGRSKNTESENKELDSLGLSMTIHW